MRAGWPARAKGWTRPGWSYWSWRRNGCENPCWVSMRPRASCWTVTAPPWRAYWPNRSEEHTSELQSLMRIPYAVFCLQKNKPSHDPTTYDQHSELQHLTTTS